MQFANGWMEISKAHEVLDVGGDIVQYLTEVHTIGCNTLAISHDIAILAVAEYLQMRFGAISVPELGGIFISDDILRDHNDLQTTNSHHRRPRY